MHQFRRSSSRRRCRELAGQTCRCRHDLRTRLFLLPRGSRLLSHRLSSSVLPFQPDPVALAGNLQSSASLAERLLFIALVPGFPTCPASRARPLMCCRHDASARDGSGSILVKFLRCSTGTSLMRLDRDAGRTSTIQFAYERKMAVEQERPRLRMGRGGGPTFSSEAHHENRNCYIHQQHLQALLSILLLS